MSFVVILRGPAGVGKSTISNKLKEKIQNAVHVDIDKFKHMISKESSNVRTNIAHKIGICFLQELIKNGFSIVVEEIFREDYYKELVKLFEDSNCLVTKVFISAPLEIVIQRDQRRTEKIKGTEVITKLWKEIQPIDEDIILDSSQYNSDEIVEKILFKAKEKFRDFF